MQPGDVGRLIIIQERRIVLGDDAFHSVDADHIAVKQVNDDFMNGPLAGSGPGVQFLRRQAGNSLANGGRAHGIGLDYRPVHSSSPPPEPRKSPFGLDAADTDVILVVPARSAEMLSDAVLGVVSPGGDVGQTVPVRHGNAHAVRPAGRFDAAKPGWPRASSSIRSAITS